MNFQIVRRFSSALTHVNAQGKINMVNVGHKASSLRTAKAVCYVSVGPEVFQKIQDNEVKKGDVITTAKIAGIQAAKQTHHLIPLCHSLQLDSVEVNINLQDECKSVEITSFVQNFDKTGVEMEALTAVTVAALTIIDMCKAIDKRMKIVDVYLLEKTGGKSGTFKYKY